MIHPPASHLRPTFGSGDERLPRPAKSEFNLSVGQATRLLLLMLVATGLIFCDSKRAPADEPVEEFLEQLRGAGYYDTALDYLDQMANSRLAGNAFQRTINYEKATILVRASATIPDLTRRRDTLDQAQQLLDQFVAENPNHELTALAKKRLADLLVEQARVNLLGSQARGVSEQRAEEMRQEARRQYDAAGAICQENRQRLNATLSGINSANQDERVVQLRDRYRAEYLQTLLLIPAVKKEKAATYDEDSAEWKQLLEAALSDYKLVQERYPRLQVAVNAHIAESEVLVKLERYPDALETLFIVLDQDNSPELRDIKKAALLQAVQCWENIESDPPKAFEAIANLQPLLATVAENEADPEWLTLKLALAKFYLAANEALESQGNLSADDRRQITTYGNLAVSIAREVSRISSPLQAEAREFLVSAGALRNSGSTEAAEPTTFAESKERARQLLDEFEAARFALQTITNQLTEETDAARRGELQAQLARAQRDVEAGPTDALKYFQLAIEMALVDDEITPDDLSSTRYFVAYIYFLTKEYENVGVISEYLVRFSPQGHGSRETCELGLNAYWTMYKSRPVDDRVFEADLLKNLSDEMLDKWPGHEAAVKAATLMSWVMIEKGDVAGAENYLAQIPDSSPVRFESELAVGQALWKNYLAADAQLRENEQLGTADAGALQRMRQEAEATRLSAVEYLEAGSKELGADNIDLPKAISTLSLAQAYVELGQSDKAILHLEKPSGLLGLLAQNHPAVADPWIVVNTYKTAVRAYIGGIEATSNKQGLIDKALAIMNRLKVAMGDTEEGRSQLVRIYLSLATDLKSQMDQLESLDQKRAFASGLVAFLDEIREGSSELNTLVWVGQSLSSIGESFAAAGEVEDAAPFFDKAGLTYVTILDRGRNNSEWLTDNVRIEVTRRLARNRKSQGNFEDAVEAYAKALGEKQGLLDVQIEAAECLQEWAASTQSSARYRLAWLGTEPQENPETGRTSNVIWGWGKISQLTGRNPNFREQFLQSRYELSRCRLEYGRIEDSNTFYEQAHKDLYQTYRLVPDLGGATWTTRYDSLLREIQRELGQSSPDGLSAFDQD